MLFTPSLPRIAFVGPIAEPGKPAGGGFAAANRRTIDLLRSEGIRVLEYAYPDVSGSLFRKSAVYGLSFTEIAVRLIRSHWDWDILHITPLLRQFLAAEALLCRIPGKLGKALFLDLRAGALIRNYHERGDTYRRRLAQLVRRASTVAVEGKSYAEFVRQWTHSEVFYFPNYVVSQDSCIPARCKPTPSTDIRLIALGRITPQKGTRLAVDIVGKAQACGMRVSLDIIGDGEPAYVEFLKTKCRQLPVSFTGPLPPAKIADYLSSSHFFIFPTTHPGEGHSNALTETMALGVVPICSDNGFNREVVEGAGAVLPKTAGAEDYLRAIQNIVDRANWGALSQSAASRVKENFSHTVVLPGLIDHYQQAYNALECAFPMTKNIRRRSSY